MIDDRWIRKYLRDAPYGALATVSNGQPFINSNLFVYDERTNVVYLHTARFGRTATNVGASPPRKGKGVPVCFSVFDMGRLLPAREAVNFSVEYSGVTVFGHARMVADPVEARRALELFMTKYAPQLQPGQDYQPITREEIDRTAVYRIDITMWSGKKKKVDPGFPNAYHYAAHG